MTEKIANEHINMKHVEKKGQERRKGGTNFIFALFGYF